MQFPIKNDIFNIIDVGGQKSERRKWSMFTFMFLLLILLIIWRTYPEYVHI